MSQTESNQNPQSDDIPDEENSEQAESAENVDGTEENPSLKEQLEAAIAERDENRNRWLRTEAELDNFRKRVQRETEELRRYQALNLARDLLPGLDNLQRALQAAESSQNVEDISKGVTMVAKQFEDILSQHSVQPIAAVGEPFDPNRHEALQQVPSAEHPPMTVVQELEKGYTLHDRVVRPSKVIVSSGPPETVAQDAQPTEDD